MSPVAPAWNPSDLRDALRAEWTKLRTVPGPAALLLAVVAATVGLSTLASATVTCPAAGCGADPARVCLVGVQLGQALVAILAVLVVGGEYGTGMIRVTVAAMPRRTTLLLAKAAVVTGPVLVAGALAVLGSVLVGRAYLPGNGFTAGHGYRVLSLSDSAVLRAAAGSVLYLALIGLLGLGLAMAVRDSAVAIGLVLGLLYLFPIVTHLVTDPHWHRHLLQIGPTDAGLSIQSTVDLKGLPLSPWAGLGVLAAWSAGALLLGGLALRLRDA